MWVSSEETAHLQLSLSSERELPPASEFERALLQFSIFTMASGVIEHLTKIYLFGKDRYRNVFCLVEMLLDGNTRELKATFKCSDREWSQEFYLQFQRALATL